MGCGKALRRSTVIFRPWPAAKMAENECYALQTFPSPDAANPCFYPNYRKNLTNTIVILPFLFFLIFPFPLVIFCPLISYAIKKLPWL